MPAPEAIDYYFAPMSGYAYLGHARLLEISKETGTPIRYHPLNMLKVFAASGSFPPSKYLDVRQHHRKADMRRWAALLNLPIKSTPAFWPVAMELACAVILAAKPLDLDQGTVAGAVLSAVWEKDLDISDVGDLGTALADSGLDPTPLLNMATTPAIQEANEAETRKAIDLGIFGSPTYVVGSEWFFGQDRLDFLKRHLASV